MFLFIYTLNIILVFIRIFEYIIKYVNVNIPDRMKSIQITQIYTFKYSTIPR